MTGTNGARPARRPPVPLPDGTRLVKRPDGTWAPQGRPYRHLTGHEQWLVDEYGPDVDDGLRRLTSCGGIALAAGLGAAAWGLLWRWLR